MIINYFIILLIIVLFILLCIKKNQETLSNIIELSPKLNQNDIINLKKGQQKMSNMLKEFDRVCRKYNLKYWCTGGTLIGTLRHNNWIPWDGDIDVAMLIDDYNILQTVIQKELPKNIWFQTSSTDKYFDKGNMGKLRDIYTYYKYTSWGNNWDMNFGIQLDIFLYKKEINQLIPFIKTNDLIEMNTNIIFPLKEAMFDNIKVYIPNQFKQYSQTAWGDFPPPMIPVEKRYPHEGNIEPNEPSDYMLKKYPELFMS